MIIIIIECLLKFIRNKIWYTMILFPDAMSSRGYLKYIRAPIVYVCK